MKNVVLFFLALLLGFPAYAAGKPAPTQQRDQIAAVVNDEAVSIPDIEARMKLIMVSSGMPNTPEFKDKIRPQILNMLIDEQLKMQAAAKLKLEVAPQEVDEGFATIASQNNFSPEQFRQILKNERIPARTLEDQIRAQIAWSKVVEKKLKPEIDVTESDIDARLQLFSANMGKNLYLVSEIFLPIDSPKQEGEVKQLAERLYRQITEQKAPFQKVAAQFS
jgi:peptidyl-prolyl cis-trans isomerase SurA